jgi:hypothetical protein
MLIPSRLSITNFTRVLSVSRLLSTVQSPDLGTCQWITVYVFRTSLDRPSNRSQISFGILLGPLCCCCCGVGVVSRPRTTRGPAGGAPWVGECPAEAPDPSLWFRECPKLPPLRLSIDSRGFNFGGGSSFSRKPEIFWI